VLAYIFFLLAYFFSTRLPLRAAYSIAIAMSWIKYRMSPRDRKAVLSNLRRILPDDSEEEIVRKAKEVFVNFGKYLVEFFRLKYLSRDQLNKYIRVEGLEHVDEALARGKGLIVVAAHLGNWELGGVMMALLGYPMVAVALPHKHRRVNDLFNRQRQRIGVTVVASMGVAVRRIYESLKNNKIVALVGDRDFANSGVRMPFLGASKIIPRGPALLTLRTGASILMSNVLRQPGDTFILEFKKLPAYAPGDEEGIRRAFVSEIEAKIRQHPTQWLMFREFWKE